MERSASTVRAPWYSAGLRFSCRPDCAACCVNHDDYAYVYLDEEDTRRLVSFLGISRRAFLRRYTEIDEGYRVLRMDRPACPFLDDNRCTVYAARPVQCRTFPFWRENLEHARDWQRLKRFCPGVDCGRLHSLLRIERQVEEHEAG